MKGDLIVPFFFSKFYILSDNSCSTTFRYFEILMLYNSVTLNTTRVGLKMKRYKQRYYEKSFNIDVTNYKVSDIIRIYLASTSLEDFTSMLKISSIPFEVEGNEK